jgi:DNA-binding NtrC family response regulator
VLRLAVHHEKSVRRFALPHAEAVLGSAEECEFHAPYPGVSRRHATLRPLDGGLLVTDLGSKNGLVRDGARHTEILLRPRESIRLGRARLELEDVDSSDAALALPVSALAARRRRESRDTGSMTELPGAGSPAAALAVIRGVERSGGIESTRPDEARQLLELGAAALEATAVWIWRGGEDVPPILALTGSLPDEQDLADFARIAREARTIRTAGASTGALLAAPLRAGLPALAARLQGPPAKIPEWKLDLFDYLASKVKRAPKRPPVPAAPDVGGDAHALCFPDEFVRGDSVAMLKLLDNLLTAARSRLDVLLLGETGTGKEMIARSIHDSGPSGKGPFLAINCAAIPAELLEAQLFGVEARVATGVDPRPGLFLKANGGSLFLDEVGDLPELLQAKLLRALQEREILPLGATAPKKIDVRVISASNKNLGALVREGRYRADLYYRLRGLQFHMPPLRERKEDLPHLVLAFAQRAAATYDKSIEGVSQKALTILTAYDWPGNIRELRNEVERAVLLCPDGGALESEHFAPIAWAVENISRSQAIENPSRDHASEADEVGNQNVTGADLSIPPSTLQHRLDEVERQVIGDALTRSHGIKSRAAAILGITRNGLAMKMRRLGLEKRPES